MDLQLFISKLTRLSNIAEMEELITCLSYEFFVGDEQG